jgi:hypothetical protein
MILLLLHVLGLILIGQLIEQGYGSGVVVHKVEALRMVYK